MRGPGSVFVGPGAVGSLFVKEGAAFEDGVDVTLSSVGASGTALMTISTALELGSLRVVGTANAVATGPATVVTIDALEVNSGSALATLVVDGGASVEAASTTLVQSGRITVGVGENGLGGHFGTDQWSTDPTESGEARMSVSGATSTIAMPSVVVPTPQRLALLADDGGVLSIAGASATGSVTGFGGIRCEATRGGRIEVAGILDLGAGNQSRISVGPEAAVGGGARSERSDAAGEVTAALTADTILTGPNSLSTFVLPIGEPQRRGAAGDGGTRGIGIAAEQVEISGPYAVTVADGWTPSGPGDVRLIATPSLSIGPYPTATPSFFGFPSITIVDGEGLLLRIVDAVDGFAMPSSVTLALGESQTLKSIMIIDGEPIDVSAQASWTFESSMVVVRTGLTTFTGIAPGTTAATVKFGSAETTVVFEVPVDRSAQSSLVSGVGLFYGNGDSGWRGPGFGVGPYGLGPRSLASDAAGNEAGRVAFMSLASNLVPGDSANTEDIFTHDLATGTIVRHTGPIPGGGSESTPWLGTNALMVAAPALSSDGRSLVGMALGTIDGVSDRRVFFVDTLTGEREIIAGLGGSGTDWNSLVSRVCVSDDGRFVAFTSRDSGLVEGDTNGVADVFVRDRELGTTQRVSLTPAGGQTIGANGLADMTPDGRFVTFLRSIGLFRLAYRFDRMTGQVVTISPGLVDDTPSIVVLDAQVSADGSEVLFVAQGTEPIVAIPPSGTPAIGNQLYRWSELAPVGDHPVTAWTRSADGIWANAPIEGFATSRNRRFIAVATKASNLAPPGPGIGDGRTRILRLDRTVALESARWEHLSLVLDEPFHDDVVPSLALNGDGTRVGLVTRASNVRPFDTAGFSDVFLLRAPTLPLGDLDGDGHVRSSDLSLLLGLWGVGDPSLTGGDLDGDGTVGVTDLAILLGAWSE